MAWEELAYNDGPEKPIFTEHCDHDMGHNVTTLFKIGEICDRKTCYMTSKAVACLLLMEIAWTSKILTAIYHS